jgi:ribosome biogenesis GTPase
LTRQRHLRIAPPVARATPARGAAPEPPALADRGWDDRWAATRRDHLADLAYQSVGYGPVAAGPVDPEGPPGSADWLPGRVTRADRGRARVATAAGEVRAAPLHPAITTGDWVLLDPAAAGPAPVRAVLPRRTALIRGAGRKEASAQVLAANIDVVLVTVALTSAPDLGRLDRLLAVAWNSGAQPIVLLTKADLSRTADTERDEIAEASPATPVILTSTVDGRGLAELRGHLAPGRTMALLGVSGAGKSSLVNALAGTEVAAVAPIRDDGKGRHTTTARELVVLPGLGRAGADLRGRRRAGRSVPIPGLPAQHRARLRDHRRGRGRPADRPPGGLLSPVAAGERVAAAAVRRAAAGRAAATVAAARPVGPRPTQPVTAG